MAIGFSVKSYIAPAVGVSGKGRKVDLPPPSNEIDGVFINKDELPKISSKNEGIPSRNCKLKEDDAVGGVAICSGICGSDIANNKIVYNLICLINI